MNGMKKMIVVLILPAAMVLRADRIVVIRQPGLAESLCQAAAETVQCACHTIAELIGGRTTVVYFREKQEYHQYDNGRIIVIVPKKEIIVKKPLQWGEYYSDPRRKNPGRR